MKKLKRICYFEGERKEVSIRKDYSFKYFYHLTAQNWGDSITLFPKAYGSNRGQDEPSFPRICVSPKAKLCFVAVAPNDEKKYCIYRTQNKLRGYYPTNVSDVRITGERWITHPVRMIKVWEIPKEILFKISHMSDGITLGGDYYDRYQQSRYKERLMNYLKKINIPTEALM